MYTICRIPAGRAPHGPAGRLHAAAHGAGRAGQRAGRARHGAGDHGARGRAGRGQPAEHAQQRVGGLGRGALRGPRHAQGAQGLRRGQRGALALARRRLALLRARRLRRRALALAAPALQPREYHTTTITPHTHTIGCH